MLSESTTEAISPYHICKFDMKLVNFKCFKMHFRELEIKNIMANIAQKRETACSTSFSAACIYVCKTIFRDKCMKVI
jgi:hypothetical protein